MIPTDQRANQLRADFPILSQEPADGKRLAYLDSGSSAQKPTSVIERQREVEERFYANAHRGIYRFAGLVDDELEASRESVREFLGANDPAEIIFTSGTTMAINLVARAWGGKFLQAGDEILLTIYEHHGNIVPWQIVAKETGATVKFLPITDAGELELSRLDEFLTERTRVVAFAGMSNVLGAISPAAELIAAAKSVGAVTLIDAAQSVPHRPVDVAALGCDFLTFSGHKLFGPSGVGVLYGRRERLEDMNPFLGGGHMISTVTTEGFTPAELPSKFEAGTLPIVQAIALKPAIDFVRDVGYDFFHEHETALAADACIRLSEVPGLRIFGPPPGDERGAILSFTIEGLHPQDLAVMLDRHAVCVRHGHHCAMPLHDHLGITASTRASYAVYNTTEDTDQLVAGIEHARRRFRLASD